MVEIRCRRCHNIIMKNVEIIRAQIKCSHCYEVNEVKVITQTYLLNNYNVNNDNTAGGQKC